MLYEDIKARRKEMSLKVNMPFAERKFKSLMRGNGEKPIFKQFIIGRMIVDFAIPGRNLLIEIDGNSHEETALKDKRRDYIVRKFGFNIVRFKNDDVWHNPEKIIEIVQSYEYSKRNYRVFFANRRSISRHSRRYLGNPEPTATHPQQEDQE